MKFIKGRQLKGEKGFTLMELMVVVLILGIVAAYGVPRYLSSIHTSKIGMVIANYDALVSDVASAYYDRTMSTDVAVAKKVGEDDYNTLSNPFGALSATRQAVVIKTGTDYEYYTGSAWAEYNSDDLAGGEVVLDYGTSGQITVTAYDDSSTPAAISGYTETISDPKS